MPTELATFARPSTTAASAGMPVSVSPVVDSTQMAAATTASWRRLGVTRAQPADVTLAQPKLLPGGKAILFSAGIAGTSVDTITIEVLTLADGRRKTLVRGGASPHFLPSSNGTGHLLYVNKATLFAIPFDLDALRRGARRCPSSTTSPTAP